jgi:flavin-dependent dehydrogenase
VSDCDVAILGAGPAGLATALTLRRHAPHLSVVVLAGPPGAREKICETLPPGAQSLLRSLDVWEAFLARAPLAAYGTAGAWGTSRVEANEFLFHPDRRGWHLDRAQFDAMLAAETAQRGVPIRSDAAPPRWTRRAERWRCAFPAGSLSARFVVDATGRPAAFASAAGATRLADDRLVALSLFFSPPAHAPLTDTYALVESTADGWWYSALQPDGRLAVACLTDADLARELRLRDVDRWLAAAHAAPHTHARLAGSAATGAPTLRLADSSCLDRLVGDDWLATGDAASTFDPLSSQGIVKALRQGTVAAYAVADHLGGAREALEKYAAFVRREHAEFTATKRDYYRRETRWPDSPFWRRRHQRIWLHPEAQLAATAITSAFPPLYLGTEALARLRAACTPSAAAHEVAEKFLAATPVATGEQVLLALQHLVESGAVTVLEPSRA